MNLSKKYQLKNYLRIFVLLLGVSVLLWNCEKEENSSEIQDETSFQNDILIGSSVDYQKINSLKRGLNKKIKLFNKNHSTESENLFINKHGELDGENVITIKFPEVDNNFMVVVPFKKDNKKLLIAYYKEGKRTFKILRNKKYQQKNNSSSEKAFLDNLDLLFSLTSGNGTNITTGTSCRSTLLYEDFENCTAAYIDCMGNIRIISTLGKDETCGGEFDEVIVIGDSGSDNDDDNDGSNSDNTDDDSYGDDTRDDDTDNDCFEYDCEEGGGGDFDDKEDVQPSCKSFDFKKVGSAQFSYVEGIRFLIIDKNGKGIYVKYDEPMEFSAPIIDRFGNEYESGAVAEASANALQEAMDAALNYSKKKTWNTVEDVQRHFEDKLKQVYSQYVDGGRIKIRPTSILTSISKYKASGITIGGVSFGTDNCN